MNRSNASTPNRMILPSFAVAVCGAMWGGFWYPLRWLESNGAGAGWVSFIFFGVMVVVPLPWVIRATIGYRELGRQLVIGILTGLAFTLYMVSLVLTDVVHAILLFYMTPVWSTLAGIALLGERLTVSRGMAMIAGFAGMAFILGVEGGIPLPRNAGDWIALLSGMMWAAGTVLNFHYPARGAALPVFFFSVGGLISSGLALAVLGGSPLAMSTGVVSNLPWIVVLALIIFVPPSYLVLWASQRIDAGRVGILLMTEVLAGAITAALFSGEHFGIRELTGTALIVCAGLVEILGRR